MPRYDLDRSPDNVDHYVLDVQAELLNPLNTRVVVPLLPRQVAPVPARQLNPVFDIGGQPFVLMTQFVATVPLSELGDALGDLRHRDYEITRALDLLLTGV